MSAKKKGTVTVAVWPRVCRACNKRKPQAEYNRCPTIFGGDGFTKDCKDCMRLKRDAKRAAKSPPEPEREYTGAKIEAGASIGFVAQLQDSDVVLWQTTADLGEQKIWLSRSEARELAKFIAELDEPTIQAEAA